MGVVEATVAVALAGGDAGVPGQFGEVGALGHNGTGDTQGSGVHERGQSGRQGGSCGISGLPAGPLDGEVFAAAVGETPSGIAGQDFAADAPHRWLRREPRHLVGTCAVVMVMLSRRSASGPYWHRSWWHRSRWFWSWFWNSLGQAFC